MAPPSTIPLRFQRAELEEKADLTPSGRAQLANAAHPVKFIEALVETGNHRDALYCLALMLPHRQAVWWGCLGTRLSPQFGQQPLEVAAVDIAESWVQSVSPGDAERAGDLTAVCDEGSPAAWVAMAAYWAGPSIAPRGQQAVAPAPHLPGIAVRTVMLLLMLEPGLEGRLEMKDLLDIGLSLMRGENGRQAQAAVKQRLFPA